MPKENENTNEDKNVQKLDMIQGNIPVLTVTILNQINNNLVRIANALEKSNG